jgi:uncharacterized membrane protein
MTHSKKNIRSKSKVIEILIIISTSLGVLDSYSFGYLGLLDVVMLLLLACSILSIIRRLRVHVQFVTLSCIYFLFFYN